MRVRILILLLLAAVTAGCAYLTTQKRVIPLRSAHQIHIKGPMTVSLINGAKKNELLVSSHGGNSGIEVRQSHGRVNIEDQWASQQHANTRIYLKLYVRNMQTIDTNGLRSLSIKTGPHAYFSANIKNTGSIHINGNATMPYLTLNNFRSFDSRGRLHIGTLNVYANGHALKFRKLNNKNMSIHVTPAGRNHRGEVNLSHMNGDKLNFKIVGNEDLHMSGKFNRLDLQAYNNARFIAPHLMLRQAYIKAYNRAMARVKVSYRLFANTTDQARVEYYGIPPHVYRNAKKASAILPLVKAGGTYQ